MFPARSRLKLQVGLPGQGQEEVVIHEWHVTGLVDRDPVAACPRVLAFRDVLTGVHISRLGRENQDHLAKS
jgi:hypothetical protein